jgi:hypothetical protein
MHRSVRTVLEVPALLVLYVVAAPLIAVLGSVGGFLQPVVAGIGVHLVAGVMDVTTETETAGHNSLGVRLVLVVVASLLAGIAVLLGTIALVLPGFYLLLRLYLFVAAVVIDDCGPVEAIAESWERTGGHLVTVAGVVLSLFLVALPLSVGTLLVTAGGVDAAVERIAAGDTFLARTVGTLVAGPLGAAATTVMYVEFGR